MSVRESMSDIGINLAQLEDATKIPYRRLIGFLDVDGFAEATHEEQEKIVDFLYRMKKRKWNIEHGFRADFEDKGAIK